MASATYSTSVGWRLLLQLVPAPPSARRRCAAGRPCPPAGSRGPRRAPPAARTPGSPAAASSALRVVHLQAGLLAQRAELLAGGGTVDVRGDQQRMVAALHQPARQLGRGGGLARALQARPSAPPRAGREAAWRRGGFAAAQQRDHLVAHHADDRLGGREALEDLLAHGPDAHPLEELLGHLEVDVGLEQGQADLAQGGVDVARASAPGPGGSGTPPADLSLSVSNTSADSRGPSQGHGASTPPNSRGMRRATRLWRERSPPEPPGGEPKITGHVTGWIAACQTLKPTGAAG